MDLLGGIGTAFNAIAGYFGQKDTNQANMELGQKQMDFQERMSNTSYQRAVQDMEKAGLNPMLAYSQGGASQPAGSLPQVQSAIGAGLASAKQGADTSAALQAADQSKAQTDLIKAQAEKVRSETMEQDLNTAMLQSQIAQLQTTTKKGEEEVTGTKLENLIKEPNVTAARIAAERAHRLFMEEDKPGSYPGSAWAADVAKRKAEARLAELGIAPATAAAKFAESEIGIGSPYLRELLNVIRGITSAGAAHRAGR